ncbi:MAG: ribosome biogenesis GTPase Der [Fidelibacterota bacterium]
MGSRTEPVVAIVGRPNVGKSTLFNRLIGSRSAIVDKREGITRDRIYERVEWAGKSFMIVDTGGYVKGSRDEILKAIRQQAQTAIYESDIILFMVDGTVGITENDDELADILKKSDKRVLLVVNKIDNQERELQTGEFMKLGIKDLYSISAITGRKVGDLLDAVCNSLKDVKLGKRGEELDVIKLAVIGMPNVGKSSYINAVLNEERLIVMESPGTTRDAVDSHFKYHGRNYTIIDTAGLRKKSKITDPIEYYSSLRTRRAIQKAYVVILLVDALKGFSNQDAKIVDYIIKSKRGMVLAVNKWDLVQKDSSTSRIFHRNIVEKFKAVENYPVFFISSLYKTRIFKIIDAATDVYYERGKLIPTSELNKVIGKIIEHSPPPSVGNRFLKVKYCTQVKRNPPVISFFVNNPDIVSENYTRFLERKIRESFGFFGVPLTLQFKRK